MMFAVRKTPCGASGTPPPTNGGKHGCAPALFVASAKSMRRGGIYPARGGLRRRRVPGPEESGPYEYGKPGCNPAAQAANQTTMRRAGCPHPAAPPRGRPEHTGVAAVPPPSVGGGVLDAPRGLAAGWRSRDDASIVPLQPREASRPIGAPQIARTRVGADARIRPQEFAPLQTFPEWQCPPLRSHRIPTPLVHTLSKYFCRFVHTAGKIPKFSRRN